MYSPPELLVGKPFTTQGDIYSLGVLLYQMVVGDLFKPLAPGWQRDVTDELLLADIESCIEGDPARRLNSAAELSRRLRTLGERRKALEQKRAAERAAVRRRRLTRA